MIHRKQLIFVHNLIYIILFQFVISVVFATDNIKISQLPDDTSLSNEQILSLMQETDALGSTNFNQYKNNITKLKQYSITFNNDQSCYYKYLVAYIPAIEGNFNSAKSQLSKLAYECENSKQNMIRIKTVLSNLQIISSEYESSIANLDYALEHLSEIEDKNLKLLVYSTASLVYRLLNQFDLSLKFSQLLLNQNPNIMYQCLALSNQNRINIQNQNTELTDEDISRSLKICDQGDSAIYANLLRLDWLKFKLRNSNNDKTAIRNILNQLQHYDEQIEKTQYSNLICIKNNFYAQIYNDLDDTKNMLKYAKMALDKNKSIGNTKQKVETLDLMINYYKQLGDYESAFKYLSEKNLSQQHYLNDKQSKVMAYQNVKHNNLAKTQEIYYLNQKNELLSHEKILTEKTTKYQNLLIISLIVIVTLISMWLLRNIKIKKMYKNLSERDHMTSIYNRKGLKDYMEYLLPYSEKNNQTVAYAIFDLDNFKQINDAYGHVTGDWVIKNVVKECQSIKNEKLTMGRIGGEEFAIVMRDSNSHELAEITEKCRKNIANLDTTPTGFKFIITASFGITTTNISGYVYSMLMTHADKAMYDAKIAGRNMIVLDQ